jgi:hypothetical protein
MHDGMRRFGEERSMRRGVSSPTMALLGAILICAAFMTACSQSDPQDAAALTALETHLGQVESQLKEVESQLEGNR